MTKHLLWAVLGFALSAGAQKPDAFQMYLNTGAAYERCVTQYAAKFAKTPESPADIASAALSACGKEAAEFHIAVLGMGKLHPEFSDDQAILNRFRTSYREAAIRTVLEVRYPQ